MLRKAEDSLGLKEPRLKQYTYQIVGKDLYVYRKRDSERHKSMHSLINVFIRDEPDEIFDTAVLYSFKLIFPPNKDRQYYFASK